MKIIYICGYTDGITGGVQTVVPQYLKYFSHYTDTYVFSYGNYYYTDVGQCVQLNSEKDILQLIKEKDAIVVFHEVYYIQYYRLAYIIKKKKVPYVVIPHCSLTDGAQEQKAILKKIFNLLWVRYFISNASRVQFLSLVEKESSRKFQCKPIIIPNGIEDLQMPCRKYIEKEYFDILFIGRYSIKQKGLDILLDACKLIKDEMYRKKIRLNLYGIDYQGGKHYIQKRIEEDELSKVVFLHDAVYGEQKINVMLKSDAFIHTSRYEGQPMSILEAMQIGLPIIVTPGTSFAEIAIKGNCGWLVKLNAHSIAEKLLIVKEEKKYTNKMSINAKNVISQCFFWNTIVNKTCQKYKEII